MASAGMRFHRWHYGGGDVKPTAHFIQRAKERANICQDDSVRLYHAVHAMVLAYDQSGSDSGNRLAYLRKAAGKNRLFLLNIFGGDRFCAVVVRKNGYPVTVLTVQMAGETPISAKGIFKIKNTLTGG